MRPGNRRPGNRRPGEVRTEDVRPDDFRLRPRKIRADRKTPRPSMTHGGAPDNGDQAAARDGTGGSERESLQTLGWQWGLANERSPLSNTRNGQKTLMVQSRPRRMRL